MRLTLRAVPEQKRERACFICHGSGADLRIEAHTLRGEEKHIGLCTQCARSSGWIGPGRDDSVGAFFLGMLGGGALGWALRHEDLGSMDFTATCECKEPVPIKIFSEAICARCKRRIVTAPAVATEPPEEPKR